MIRKIAGGGIFSNGGELTLQNVSCVDNIVIGFGWCIVGASDSVTCPASFGGTLLKQVFAHVLYFFVICFFERSKMLIEGGGARFSTDYSSGCVAAVASRVSFSECRFASNQADCSNNYGMCTSSGGAVAISRSSAVSVSRTIFRNNICICSPASGCTRGSGGAHFSDSGSVSVVNSSFVENIIFGIGGGGAVSLTGDSRFSSVFSLFLNNTAREGGGFWLLGSSIATLLLCNISLNSASSVAGILLLLLL